MRIGSRCIVHYSAMLLVGSLLCVSTTGCGSAAAFRSTPPDASVFVNNTLIGRTPVRYSTRDVRPLPYRIEKDGYPPFDGILTTRISPGRVVGAVFTFGILLIFKPIYIFWPERIDVTLGSEIPAVATIHLYNVKTATVFDGECIPQNGKCWLDTANGERCQGEFVRENQGTTTVTATTKTTTGGAIGAIGGNLAGGTFGAQNSSVGSGREFANMNAAVAMLRCGDNIIACSLTVDTLSMQGHGKCQDSKGQDYRVTFLPKGNATP